MTQELALDGYDPVTYFDGGPRRGTASHALEWGGKRWQFESAENLEAFRADPERYAPAYGGSCAFAMSFGKEVEASPEHFRIADGRLFLQAAGPVTLLHRLIPGRIRAADAHWARMSGGGR